MPDVLVIQWARLGDLCHTRPLLDSLKQELGEDALWLSYDAHYRDLIDRFPEVDRHLPISLKQTVAGCRTDSMLCETMMLLDTIVPRQAFRRVINITNHPAAIRFATAMRAETHHGYGFAEDAVWSSLMSGQRFANTRSLRAPSHVADIWKAGLCDNDPLSVPASLGRHLQAQRSRRLGIVSDAGDRMRDLTPATIEALIEAAACTCDEIVLLGGRAHRSSFPGVRDLRGETSLAQLMEILDDCQFVIGPDTGALHLAASLGCSVFGLYFNGAAPARTGPYSLDSRCVVAPSREDLQDDDLKQLVGNWLEGSKESLTSSQVTLAPNMMGGCLYNEPVESPRQEVTADGGLSVIIVECGQVHYTDELLRDIEQCALPTPSEIIVVSSDLDEADCRHASERVGITAIQSAQRLSFAEANNLAARRAKKAWLLFINDDCRLAPKSFETLWNARNSERLTAPTLIYWDGELQSAGIQLDASGVRESTEDGLHNANARRHDFDAVSAAAMICSRQLFQDMSGFDEKFINGYEDVDFCLRARARGITSEIIDEPVVHFRSSSRGRFDRDDQNLALLKEKWPTHFTRSAVAAPTSTRSCPIILLSDCEAIEAGSMIRWISPLERLELQRGSDFEWLSRSALTVGDLRKVLANAQTLIVFRSLSNRSLLNEIETWRRNTNATLIYDCDDLLLGRFQFGTPRAAMRAEYESLVSKVLSLADICTAPHAELLSLHGVDEQRQVVLPSVPMPEHFRHDIERQSGDVFRIGYAGGAAHLTDFGQIAPALERVLSDCDDIEFYWWGSHPGPLANHPAVRRGGAWMNDYSSHLKRIQRVPIDLWLVPLAETQHNCLRSPVKAFEYGGMESAALYSDCEPYSALLTGHAAEFGVRQTTQSWYDKMRSARAMVRGEEFRQTRREFKRTLESRSADLGKYRQLITNLKVPSRQANSWSDVCTA